MNNYSDYLKTLADRDRKLEDLADRSYKKRTWNLHDFIISEQLFNYEYGCIDILYADRENSIVIPCEYYLILAREHFNEQTRKFVSEYALYIQEDHDGHPLRNTYNMHATYHFRSVCEESFDSLASAIAHAHNAITNGTGYDDPVELIRDNTEPNEAYTASDAQKWIIDMTEAGYKLQPTFTPNDFLAIYADLESADGD